MPQSARPPAIAPLDVLLHSHVILRGDYRAGREFAFLARRRNQGAFRPLFEAAIAALDAAGGRHMVEAVVLDGQMPRTEHSRDELATGLDALYRHFRRHGLPMVLVFPAGGGRPVFRFKRRRA